MVTSKLSSYLLRLVSKENSDHDNSFDGLLSSLQDSLGSESAEVIGWLTTKVSSIFSPDAIEDIMEMIREVLRTYFNKKRNQRGVLFTYLTEITLVYDTCFFEGLSRLFLQTQAFLHKAAWATKEESLSSLHFQTESSLSISIDSSMLSQDSHFKDDSEDSFSLGDFVGNENSFTSDAKAQGIDTPSRSSFLLETSQENFVFDTDTGNDTDGSETLSTSSLGAFGSDQVSLTFPHSPVLSRKPLQEMGCEENLLLSPFEGDSMCTEDDDITPTIESFSLHYWSPKEASWSSQLREIQTRRVNALPFGALSPSEVYDNIQKQVEYLSQIIQRGFPYSESPKELESRIHHIRQLLPNENRLHYVLFLFFKQQRNLPRALEELHRYFDYQLFASKISSHNILPYTVLSLASLYYEFGNYEEGLEAVRESIRLSQERNDDSSLVHALYWLYCYLKEGEPGTKHPSPEETENHLIFWHKTIKKHRNTKAVRDSEPLNNHNKLIELLGRCLHRATERKMSVWFTLNILSLTELLLRANDLGGLDPSESGSSLLAHQETIWNLLAKSEKSSLEGNLQALMGKYAALRSSVWNQYGHKDLSRLYAQISMEQLKALKGQGRVQGSEHNKTDYGFTQEDICFPFCQISFQHSQDGQYEKAFSLMLDLHAFVSLSHQTTILLSHSLTLLIDYAINRGNLAVAEELLFKLRPHHLFQYWEYKARILLSRGQYKAALSLAFDCIQPLVAQKSDHNWKEEIRFTLLLSEIYVALEQCSVALSYVLTAFALSKKHKMYPSLIQSTLLLAEVQTNMKLFTRALHLVEEILPLSAHHAGAKERAHTHLLIGKVLFLQNQRENWHLAPVHKMLHHLTMAQIDFTRLEQMEKVKETCYYLARCYDSNSQTKERDEAAALFVQASKTLKVRENSLTHPRFFGSPSACMAEQLSATLRGSC